MILSDHSWTGGLYYGLNLIHAMNQLEESEQPNLVVFYSSDIARKSVEAIHYPYLKMVNFNQFILKKLLTKITGKDYVCQTICQKYQLDALYPYTFSHRLDTSTRVIAWLPDFQHKHMPEHFSEKESLQRDHYIEQCKRNQQTLVMSSQAVLRDFKTYYPEIHIVTSVCPFTSYLISPTTSETQDCLKRYKLKQPYYMVCNQFHRHKNHLLVLKALLLVQRPCFIVMTGAVDNTLANELKAFISKHQLQENVALLGFIPREDQTCLIKASEAMIQPSLFEGWNTGIEDAKTLQHPLLASDLPVHREQLGEQAQYFDPHDPEDLAKQLSIKPAIPKFASYHERSLEFARSLLATLFKQEKN